MWYHSDHLKLYFEKYTVLHRGDLRNKSEIKHVPSVQILFSPENDTLIFYKNPTCFHNLLSMTSLVRYRELINAAQS